MSDLRFPTEEEARSFAARAFRGDVEERSGVAKAEPAAFSEHAVAERMARRKSLLNEFKAQRQKK